MEAADAADEKVKRTKMVNGKGRTLTVLPAKIKTNRFTLLPAKKRKKRISTSKETDLHSPIGAALLGVGAVRTFDREAKSLLSRDSPKDGCCGASELMGPSEWLATLEELVELTGPQFTPAGCDVCTANTAGSWKSSSKASA